MKKISFCYLVLFFSSFFIFAERAVDFSVTFEPSLIINTDNPKNSAPAPVVYPLSFGIIFPRETLVSFQPRVSFFSNYYLWNNSGAYPAEIENRTATAFSFLIDLPAAISFSPLKKHFIDAGAGPAILARFAVLSHAVHGSDAGYNGNTASDDVAEINRYFWKDANFLFIDTYFSYLYAFTENLKAGPEIKFYLPCSVFSKGDLNSAIISVGIKTRF